MILHEREKQLNVIDVEIFRTPFYTFIGSQEDHELFAQQYRAFKNGKLSEFPEVVSARPTGLMGIGFAEFEGAIEKEHYCPSGVRGPNGPEVLVGMSKKAVEVMVQMGFIPCYACKPHEKDWFWELVKDAAYKKHSVESPEEFFALGEKGVDIRDLDWKMYYQMTNYIPKRVYLPRDLEESEVEQFLNELQNDQIPLPKEIGWYPTQDEQKLLRKKEAALGLERDNFMPYHN